ncbi:hypothetical protein MAR_034107 [Mya arenaria]|uniref:Uncharacterized protein n=1 Tax=Mya arenaria TaxID=6604 RepID=A0ABY7GAX9_MYAAR|nr:hypothetical protein MAR_034107 [Mya arenaria]
MTNARPDDISLVMHWQATALISLITVLSDVLYGGDNHCIIYNPVPRWMQGKTGLVNVSQCYHCDSSAAGSTQSDVMNPEDCVTLTTCDANEMCKLLMKRAFEHLQECDGREGTEGCQFQSTCYACCADGGCNYSDCSSLQMTIN